MGAYQKIQQSLTAGSQDQIRQVLTRDFMSSEESEYEEEANRNGQLNRKKVGFTVKELPWERSKLKKLKVKLDQAYFRSLSAQAQAMTLERSTGALSTRPAPAGPAWAVRGSDSFLQDNNIL